MIYSTNKNFTLGFKEILDKLEISKDDCYRALPILNDEFWYLHLKREPNSCLFNNYFDVGLKASLIIWTYNLFLMSIRQWHICVNIYQKLKIDVYRKGRLWEKAAKEGSENKMHHHDTMKTTAKA